MARRAHGLRAADLHPVHRHRGGIVRFAVGAEGQRERPPQLAQVDFPHAPPDGGLDPAVHGAAAGLERHFGGARREAGQPDPRGQAAGADGEGQLQPRAVLRPAEHRLPAPGEPIALPARAQPAREGRITRPHVHEEGLRALQAGDEKGGPDGPRDGEEEGEPAPG